MKKYKYPSVLTIAGFDGSGGAGIQADIKTISALGCYATSVLTALPVQNTQGVRNIFPIPVEVVSEQIEAILDDIFPDAIKIGMVHTPELVETIVKTLAKYKKVPIVFDPVMVATSGHRLIEEKTIETIIEKLFPISDIITPNMDEAAILAKMGVKNLDDMKIAGERIKELGCKNILLKGGHLETEMITSLLYNDQNDYQTFKSEKVDTKNTHGSGCTLSSAIASFIARGKSMDEAIAFAQYYVSEAVLKGSDVQTGKGNGPLNHFFSPQKLIKNELV
ncbi:bifunctional hydroxymethylpyrimidine kinase/phosphomethylpyrimidine kinase [Chryseobacterium sp. 2R14A]|uniref:bifunctional hydroxymethylpyrimidine kinase/phosphomethylpyrimidine kinase n=1 Tax=Chryseobacterium sp. 2R14A TaxID=3380353 RepID=UPI003CEF1857